VFGAIGNGNPCRGISKLLIAGNSKYNSSGDAIELNNNIAHRTHNNTVSWFIPLQSDTQTLRKLDEKTSKENLRSLYFFDSSCSSLLSTHVLFTLVGSPSPNLVVLINITKLGGVGLVNLSYTTPLKIVARNFYSQT